MASTSVGKIAFYKTASGYIPAIIEKAYTVSGSTYTEVDAVATTASSVDAADLLVLGLAPVRIRATKQSDVGSEGGIAAATFAADVLSVTTGKWFTITES